jgi:hypothetical protein
VKAVKAFRKPIHNAPLRSSAMTTDRKPRPAVVGLGALALGAIAFGAFAVGAIAIGRLAIGRASIRRLNIDELAVRKLSITGEFKTPPK